MSMGHRPMNMDIAPISKALKATPQPDRRAKPKPFAWSAKKMPPQSNPFAFLPGTLRLASGVAADYRQLERFHYLPGRPASFARIWTLRFLPDITACPKRIIAVAVLSYPPLRCAARERVLGLTLPDSRQLAPFVNRHLRTISRVIVHPQFRGIGLASLLIRATCALADTPFVEAIARMGASHPLFERGGMRRHPTLPREAAYFLYRATLTFASPPNRPIQSPPI